MITLSTNQFRFLVAGLAAIIVVLGGLVVLSITRGPRALKDVVPVALTPPASAANAANPEAHPQLTSLPPGTDASFSQSAGSQAVPSAPAPQVGQSPPPQADQPAEGSLQFAHDGAAADASPLVTLPPGLYQVSFQTDASFGTLAPVVTQGDCGQYPFFVDESGPFAGRATYRSLGCQVYFVVSEIDGPWTIHVEPTREEDVVAVPLVVTGSQPTTSDPVNLPSGIYHLAFETASPYGLVTPVVADGQCDNRPIFVVNEPGHFEADYLSLDCQVVFQVSYVTADWELAVVPGE